MCLNSVSVKLWCCLIQHFSLESLVIPAPSAPNYVGDPIIPNRARHTPKRAGSPIFSAESIHHSGSRVFALVDGRKTPPVQVATGLGTSIVRCKLEWARMQ